MTDEIKALREELKRTQIAYQMAAQMCQFKAGFLARTAHELRSPLSNLMGLHQLILSNLCESPEEEREFITQANVSAQKLLKLLDEVIAVSKLAYGSNQPERQCLQLTQVFSDVHRLTYLQAANRNLPLNVVSPDPNLYVEADEHWLLQALVNLLDTAIGHTKSGIQISAEASDSEMALVCIDLCCSISIASEPADLLQQVQTLAVNGTVRQPEVSPGMRLWLSQNLLETMGGRLEIVELSSSTTTDSFTRIQCSIPQIPAEQLTVDLLNRYYEAPSSM